MATDSKKFEHLYGRPAPWTNLPNGQEFVNYLTKVENEHNEKSLNDEEKKCLESLKAYRKNSEDGKEEDLQYEEDSIDWERLKTPYDISFYLSFPSFMLSNMNKNIQNFVKTKHKTMTLGQIADYAKERAAKQSKENADGKDKDDKKANQEENQETEQKDSEETPKEAEHNARTNLFEETKRFAIVNNKDIKRENAHKDKNLNEQTQINPEKIDPEIINKIENYASGDAREM